MQPVQDTNSVHMGAYGPADLADRFALAARIEGRRSNSEALRIAMLAYVEAVERQMEKQRRVKKRRTRV